MQVEWWLDPKIASKIPYLCTAPAIFKPPPHVSQFTFTVTLPREENPNKELVFWIGRKGKPNWFPLGRSIVSCELQTNFNVLTSHCSPKPAKKLCVKREHYTFPVDLSSVLTVRDFWGRFQSQLYMLFFFLLVHTFPKYICICYPYLSGRLEYEDSIIYFWQQNHLIFLREINILVSLGRVEFF